MEYWISHVEHETAANGSKGAIKRVCAWKLDAATAQPVDKTAYTRARIVELLKTNVLYTATRGAQGNWKKGAKVVLTDDGKYITTERTATTRDNLGELPLCDC
ncbi:hypothetical protein [Nannocystis pusilla]|uniref:hypothetical protein n=1 Tax=Nannocystis pusilla TaxID=889268 RepID=UPI003DA2AAB8